MACVCVGTLPITGPGLTMSIAHEATRPHVAVEVCLASRRGAACYGEIAVGCRSPSRRRAIEAGGEIEC